MSHQFLKKKFSFTRLFLRFFGILIFSLSLTVNVYAASPLTSLYENVINQPFPKAKTKVETKNTVVTSKTNIFTQLSTFLDKYYDSYTSGLALVLYGETITAPAPSKTTQGTATPLQKHAGLAVVTTSSTLASLKTVVTSSSTQTKIVYIQGPKGDTGPQGPQGPKGDAGLTSFGSTITSSSPNPVAYMPVGITIPNPSANFTGGEYASIANLTSNLFTNNTSNIITLNVSGNQTVTGNSSVGGTFNVTGATTLSGNLNVTGTITGSVTGAMNPALTNGSVFFQDTAGISQDNANFFYDKVNHRLGLGTVAPVSTLHVNGTSTISSASDWTAGLQVRTSLNNGNMFLTFDDTANGTAPLQIFTSNSTGGQIWSYGSGTIFLAGNKVGINTGGKPGATDAALVVKPTSTYPILNALSSSGASAFYVANGGNVGIGTTTPSDKLHVFSSTGTVRAYIDYNGTVQSTIGSGTGGWGWVGTETNSDFNIITNNTRKLTVTSTGNVGIGTTGPTASLTVSNATLDSTNGIANFYNPNLTDGQSNFVVIGKSAALGQGAVFGELYSVTQANAGAFVGNWGDSVGTGLFVRKGGNVGIGTTNPLTKFDVTGGNIRLNNGTLCFGNTPAIEFGIHATLEARNAQIYGIDPDCAGTNVGLGFSTYGSGVQSQKMTILAGGNVGIGTTTPVSLLTIGSGTPTTLTSGLNFGTDTVANLYRSATSTIKTDGAFTVAGNLQANAGTFIQTSVNNNGLVDVYPGASVGPSLGGRLKLNALVPGSAFQYLEVFAQGGSVNTVQISTTAGNGGVSMPIYVTPGGNQPVAFQTSGTGNVGIGTTAPGALLNVNGNFLVNKTTFQSYGGQQPIGEMVQASIANTDVDGGTLALLGSGTATQDKGAALVFGQSYTGTTMATGARVRSGKENSTAGNYASYLAFDTRAMSANLAEVMRISSTGNVGIGTTSPGYGLDVASANTTARFWAQGAGVGTYVNIRAGASQGSAHLLDFLNSAGSALAYVSATGDGVFPSVKTTDAGVYLDGTSLAAKSTWSLIWSSGSAYTDTKDLGLSRGAVGKLYVGNGTQGDFTGTLIAGNVGIGTTGPGVRLQVRGAANVNTPVLGTNTGSFSILSGNDGLYGLYAGTRDDGGVWLQTGRNDANTATYGLLLNPSGGNVGIGTVSPLSPLDVGGSPAGGIASKLTVTGTKSLLGTAGIPTNQVIIYDDSAMAAGVGGAISFSGVYTTGGLPLAVYGSIQGIKENGTSGNYAGQLQFLTRVDGGNDTVKMVINNQGNVGIGTTGPLAPLHVKGPASGAFNTIAEFNSGVIGGNNTGSMIHVGLDTTRVEGGRIYGGRWANGSDTGMRLSAVAFGGGENAYIDVRSANSNPSAEGHITFNTASTDRMIIDNGGNVGIGTTAPSYKLDIATAVASDRGVNIAVTSPTGTNYGVVSQVTGAATNNTGLYGYATGATSNYGLRIPVMTAGANNWAIYADAAAQSYFAGNVGIGTTVTSAKLEVQKDTTAANFNAGNTQLLLRGSSIDDRLYQGVETENHYAFIQSFSTTFGGMPLALQSKGGNVGIGTTGPANKLDITGDNIGLTGSGGVVTGIKLTNTDSVSNTWTLGSLGTAGSFGVSKGFSISQNGGSNIPFQIENTAISNALYIKSNGNVGIGTTAPGAPLEVKGTGTGATIAKFTDVNTTGCAIATGGTIACSSDVRLKKNIENINYGLSTVMQLRPVLYNWNYETDGQTKSLGFIAQEVEALIPKLVATDDQGMKSLNTTGIIPILTKGIQELDLKIQPLTSLNVEESGSLASLIRDYLENAVNGLRKVFVGEVHTDKLCVGNTCVTEAQLQQLLQNASGSVVNNGGGNTPPPEPTPDPVCTSPQTLVNGVCVDPAPETPPSDTPPAETP